MCRNKKFGFTIIEILVVIGVILVLTLVSVSVFKNINKSAALSVSAQSVYTSFTTSRNKTLASEGGDVFGIHIDADSVTEFVGSTYSPAASTNITHSFFRGVTATSSFSDSSEEILFSRLTGNASATGTITLSAAEGDATTTLTIFTSGLIE